jgi:hypothetical protein
MTSRCIPVTLLVGALVFSSPQLGSAQSPDTATPAFKQALLNAADQLDKLSDAARRAPHNKAIIPDLRLPPEPVGELSSGRPSLDRWLQSELKEIRKEKSGKTRSSALKQLAASLRGAAQPGESFAPSHDAHDEAASILAQRAYQTGGAGPAPAPKQSLLEKALAWLGERIADLFARIFGATTSTPIIGQIVGVVFIALLAGAAAYLIFVLTSLVIRRRRPSQSDVGTPLQEQSDPDVLYQLGMTAASQGHYARAVSLLFQASLASFDRAGKLPYDGSLTAGEYRRAVRRTLTDASPYFDDIARAFVLAAFAERPVSKDDFTAADAAYRSLRPLVVS